MKPFNELRIAICNDHAGYDLKRTVLDHLKAIQVGTVEDFGSYTSESCDYPDFAHPLALAVEKGEFDFGITICGSGNGISMTANKHKGIRSALCWENEIASLARRHNNANVISLPARFITENEAKGMIDIFLSTDFEGGRHQRRVDKIPY
ncbi:MAG: ribose 5-phosphate isomerase B [Bacteroidota bacterium]|nr:ribose 5-phosphate isomerase B [Bacteroidota bacterium]